jgi:hypothetical protein
MRGHATATNERELFADHTTTARAEQADLRVIFQLAPEAITRGSASP